MSAVDPVFNQGLPMQIIDTVKSIAELNADGESTLDKALVASALADAAQAKGYRGDMRGLRTFLHWRLTEFEDDARAQRARADRQRGQADWAIRAATRPLLQQRRPSQELFAAAHEANARLGTPLSRAEVKAVVSELMGARLAQMQGHRRYG